MVVWGELTKSKGARAKSIELSLRVLVLFGDEETGASLNMIALELGCERWEVWNWLRAGRRRLEKENALRAITKLPLLTAAEALKNRKNLLISKSSGKKKTGLRAINKPKT